MEIPMSEISSYTPNEDVFEYIDDKIGVPAYEYEILPTKENAQELWDNLTDDCVDDEDGETIESDWFFQFEKGSSKYSIWKWIEEYFHVSVVEELM